MTAAATTSNSTGQTSDSPSPAKQVKIDLRATGLSAAELKKLVAGYIVEDMLPISTVDSESFRRIVEKIPTKSGVKLPQRKSFAGYLEREYDIMDANLKATLGEVDFVSTTADIWTVNNKSFMGVTIHWINSTLQRKKAALACKRIRGRHTYDVIGAEIEEIHSSYGLHGKVVATVTDNASNFAKAFRVYQPCNLESESENEEEGDDEEPTFTDVIEALSTASGDGQFSLPPHYRCASHTINLISTSDVDKHLNSCADTKAVYRSSIAKCTALWTKASRSTLTSEQVEEVSRRKLMVPTSTRWNSLYEAISRIITIPLNELNPLCVKLGIKCLNEREYQFLKEYCTVMKPLTVALDILQGDECTYWALLPSLTSLMPKTLALKDDLSRMTASLPDVIVKAIKTRFDAVLDSQEGLLAVATCPKFKLRWLRDERRREHVKELLTTDCRKAAPATDNANVSQLPASPAEMDFFDFENQPTESFSAEKEVTDYLRSGYELEILNQFPNLKKMYMKYNTPTPSSAPVERLFSLGGLVLSPKRNRLSDRRFEKLLLMRYNHCFTPKENKKT
ncbi:putative AC transposase [Dissostichus eleginoides]|uniref:AC transposase n=1 Tax=Dissostichus eleginoides TaxID=100907 RepID=A0AAD9BIH5_DISEL|nr:putative AC transposase [Dissostichus eleginoides]